MNYADIMLFYMIMDGVKNILLAMTIIGIVSLCVFGFIIFIAFTDDVEEFKKFSKHFKISCFVFIPFIMLNIFIPKTEYMISYMLLKEVDKYKIENPNSITNPSNMLKTVDDIATFSTKLLEVGTKGLDVLEKKIESEGK